MSLFQSYFDSFDTYLDTPFLGELAVASSDSFETIEDYGGPSSEEEGALDHELFGWIAFFGTGAFGTGAPDLLTTGLPLEMALIEPVGPCAGDPGPGVDLGRVAVDSDIYATFRQNMLRTQVGLSPNPPGFTPY